MKFLGIEALRGVAAVLVVLLHATNMLTDPHQPSHLPFYGFFLFGRAGVDFFFVLSGFIIAYVHAGDLGKPSASGMFWRKRLLRVYPIYWVITAIYCTLFFFSPTRERFEQDPLHILTSLLLLPDQYVYPIVSVAWSLRHEILFYALFGLIILNRMLGLAVMSAWFAAIVFNMAWAMVTGHPYFGGLWGDIVFRVFNIEFLFGLGAAWALRRHGARRPSLVAGVGAALFFLNGMAESFLRPVMHEWPVRHLIYATASAMVIYGVATLDRQRRSRVAAPLVALGGASYSLYLIHVLLIMVLAEILKRGRVILDLPTELVYLIVVSGTVLIAVAFSRIVEQPILRAGNRLFIGGRVRHDQPALSYPEPDSSGVRDRPRSNAR